MSKRVAVGSYGYSITFNSDIDFTDFTDVYVSVKSAANGEVDKRALSVDEIAHGTDNQVKVDILASDFAVSGLHSMTVYARRNTNDGYFPSAAIMVDAFKSDQTESEITA